MSDHDPDRLSSGSDDPQLRELLGAGRRELPDEKQLAAVLAKLGPALGAGGGGGGGGAAGTSGTAGNAAWVLTAKWVAVAAGLTAALWGARQATRGAAPMTREAGHVAVAPPRTEVDAPNVPPAPSTPPVLATPPWPASHGKQATASSRPAPTAEIDPSAEVKLVEQAEDALSTDPALALSLADEDARRFPDGMLRQEAEVIAIDGLARMNRRPAAEERAKRFRAAYPTSASLRRIDVVLARTR